MQLIKTKFSIKDLENLSGIKAHTIRIWEKRYGLLKPERTDTNIRYYSAASLQKILNVALLNKNGVKISKISLMPETDIIDKCRTLIEGDAIKDNFINDLKFSMFNFDSKIFNNSYTELLSRFTFEEIFNNFFIPFLNEIGLLWQTETINPAHEHFISSLIKQKVLLEIEKIQYKKPEHTEYYFILFLPDQEIHDLGLTYIHYLLLSKGLKSIYLGQSIPIDNLSDLKNIYDKINFVTYFTVKPSTDKITNYINKLYDEIISLCNCNLWVMGRKAVELESFETSKNIDVITNIESFMKKINQLTKHKNKAS